MTVGQLRKRIEGVDDNIPVVLPAHDHGYYNASCAGMVRTAEKWHGSTLKECEAFGEEYDHLAQEERPEIIEVFSIE